MRIAVFTAYFYPHKGGVERYVYEIYRRLVTQGIGVDVITCNTNNAPAEEVFDGIQIYRLDCWHLLGDTYPVPKINGNFLRVMRALNRKSYTFINTQTRFFIQSFIGFLYGKIKGIKVIHTEHGTQHSILSNPVTNLLSKIYDHTFGYIVTKYADCNIAISEASAEFSKHLGASQYTVIYNGTDTNKFKRIQTDLKNCLEISPEYMIITFLGRLIEAKGVQDLIEVFQEISQSHKVKLLIIGSGNYSQELKKMAADNPDILFVGEKSEEEIVDSLSITDIFVNPSYSEGLPTSVLEAASCGCSIIASDVGGTKEIIHDGKNGALFHVRDREELGRLIKKFIEDQPAREQYGVHARDAVSSKFDWDVIVSRYMLFLNNQV